MARPSTDTSTIFRNWHFGQVGIGTTAPEDKLDIVGNLRICSSKPLILIKQIESEANIIT